MIRSSKSVAGALRIADPSMQTAVGSSISPDRFRAVSELHSRAAAYRPTVSVVVCTRNRPDDLRECFHCIAKLMPRPDEVIVVDNSQGDAESELLARSFGARYVVEPVVGLSRARNRGMKESRCEIVAYLDDDCLPDREWLEYLLRPFADSSVAAVTGEIVRFTDLEKERRIHRCKSHEVRYLNRETPRWFEMAAFGGVGIGTNMAFRKAVASNQALFDERLGRGAPFQMAEENCAFASLISMGYSIVRTSAAEVLHPEKPLDACEETKLSIAYSFLLFSRFSENRLDLLRFLLRRIARQPVSWRLEAEQSGIILASSWRERLKAFPRGVALFLRARRYSPQEPLLCAQPVDNPHAQLHARVEPQIHKTVQPMNPSASL